VRYWLMEVDADTGFVPNDEVDELRRLPIDEALGLLTYDRDHDVVRAV
jgi:8-oxo-(d)GTP phosphatase